MLSLSIMGGSKRSPSFSDSRIRPSMMKEIGGVKNTDDPLTGVLELIAGYNTSAVGVVHLARLVVLDVGGPCVQ